MLVNPNQILKLYKMIVFKKRQNKTCKLITKGKKREYKFRGLLGRPSFQDLFSAQNAVALRGNSVFPQKQVMAKSISNGRRAKEFASLILWPMKPLTPLTLDLWQKMWSLIPWPLTYLTSQPHDLWPLPHGTGVPASQVLTFKRIQLCWSWHGFCIAFETNLFFNTDVNPGFGTFSFCKKSSASLTDWKHGDRG